LGVAATETGVVWAWTVASRSTLATSGCWARRWRAAATSLPATVTDIALLRGRGVVSAAKPSTWAPRVSASEATEAVALPSRVTISGVVVEAPGCSGPPAAAPTGVATVASATASTAPAVSRRR
jgi:hypothetical protein